MNTVPHAPIEMISATHDVFSGFVEAGGVRWYVRRLGSGPVMLLVHGTGASSHSWDGLVEHLLTEFQIIAVDLPGHGRSQALPSTLMTLDSLARCLGELLSALRCTPASIVGHSAGAAIALRMVLDGRITSPRHVVSLNGALLQWQGMARWVFPPLARLVASAGVIAPLLAARASRPGAVERMLAGTGKAPPAASVAVYETLMRNPVHVQATLDMMARWDLDALERDLPKLTVPLELIACGGDLAVPSDVAFKVQKMVPVARVTYLRNLGHLAHEEDPETIAGFIKSIWSGRKGAASSRALRNGGAI